MKKRIVLGIIYTLLVLIISIVKINAATITSSNSLSVQSINKKIYTLPQQLACESPKGKGQDRQALGYIMKPGSSLTITNNSDIVFTIQLLNNNSSAQISQKVNPHKTVVVKAPNPPESAVNRNGRPVNEASADVDLVPFVLTPRTTSGTESIDCNFSIDGPKDSLPIFSYGNDQDTFMNQWKRSGSYALIGGNDFQILLPVDAQLYVNNMDKAPMGLDKKGNPNPIPESNSYICHNLKDVLNFYDKVLFPTYRQIAGLSSNASEPCDIFVPGKYFYTADIKGSGGANYSPARTEISGPNDQNWLQPSWVLFHETGHGYQTRELGSVAQHVGEVSNNALGNYMYYHLIYKNNPELADKYSWNYNGNKEMMETSVYQILKDNNWSWDQILPNNGGRGKHVGLILLQNMIEKMSYDGWTEVYRLDRQQINEPIKNRKTNSSSNSMNIWNLIMKAALDHGYDYTAIMTKIGKLPENTLSQAAREKQDKSVDFLWDLMPNATYGDVFKTVQELKKTDPNLVYDSDFTLVTPEQTKTLGLTGKLNLTIHNLPVSWIGKNIAVMNGNKVYGELKVDSNGECSLDNLPLGTYTLAEFSKDNQQLTNYYVTVKSDPNYMNSTKVVQSTDSELLSNTNSILSSSLGNKEGSLNISSNNKSLNGKESALISSSSSELSSNENSSEVSSNNKKLNINN